jgi:ArsR family transcriptional regulator
MSGNDIKKIVKKSYTKIAKNEKSCCCKKSIEERDIARAIGYSDEDINSVSEANLGLGCGNPVAHANIREGDTVLDLGSGAGFDCFLAANKVGKSGKVIGIDMTEDMVEKARKLADKYDYKNVEFRLGDIESIPVENESIDIIISNCVINLAPDKLRVFQEGYRILKPTGKMYVSDIVLLEELTKEQRNNEELIAGCVGGALLKDEYLKIVKDAGFRYKILDEDREISKKQYQGINLESLKIELRK